MTVSSSEKNSESCKRQYRVQKKIMVAKNSFAFRKKFRAVKDRFEFKKKIQRAANSEKNQIGKTTVSR